MNQRPLPKILLACLALAVILLIWAGKTDAAEADTCRESLESTGSDRMIWETLPNRIFTSF